MAILKKYDLKGKEIGEVTVDDNLLQVANTQMVKDYLVAIRNNARRWTASTKSRSEVCHSGQKPHRQKGTGKARQGSLAAPQYKGGGRVFTPRPKFDQHVKVNKKEKRIVIKSLLSEKIMGDKIKILECNMKKPKTKSIASFLESLDIACGRVLFLFGEKSNEVVIKSLRNIPKKEFAQISDVNGYEIALSSTIVIMDKAVNGMLALLEANK